MNNKFGLPERTIRELLEYFESKPKIERVAYSSRAKGTYKVGSDIDFAVWTSYINIAQLATDLDDLSTPYMFDVTDYNTLSHENLKKNIDNEGVEFYKKNDIMILDSYMER